MRAPFQLISFLRACEGPGPGQKEGAGIVRTGINNRIAIFRMDDLFRCVFRQRYTLYLFTYRYGK